MAEVGGVSVSVRQTSIPGDVVDETHSAWTVELVGATVKVCTVSWRTFRKWNDSRVVLEHHYDHQQSGEPLSDLRSNLLEPSHRFSQVVVNTKGVSGTERGRSKMANSVHWPHIKCDLGPVGLIQLPV